MQRGSHCLRGPHRRGPQGEKGPHLPASDSPAGRTILFKAPSWRLGCSLLLKRGHISIKAPVVAQPVAKMLMNWRAASPRRERDRVCERILLGCLCAVVPLRVWLRENFIGLFPLRVRVGEDRDLESGGASFEMRIARAREVLIEVLTTNQEVLIGSGPRVCFLSETDHRLAPSSDIEDRIL